MVSPKMGHVTAKLDWATIDIDTSAGAILVQEDWFYDWTSKVGASAWTYAQKHAFHRKLDLEIWSWWSNRHLKVEGTSPFAQRFAKTSVLLNYDIRWDLRLKQWKVTIIKLPPGQHMDNSIRSFVAFDKKEITLYSIIFEPYSAWNGVAGDPPQPGFMTGPHEFGHTLDDPWGVGNGDEYRRPGLPDSPHLRDFHSLMNVGREIRARHLQSTIEALNRMIPGTTFHV